MKCKHNKRIEDCYDCFWDWQSAMIELWKLLKKESND